MQYLSIAMNIFTTGPTPLAPQAAAPDFAPGSIAAPCVPWLGLDHAPPRLATHAALARGPAYAARRVDLVLAGPRGKVGVALWRQLARQQAALRDSAGLDLRLLACFDRHGLAHALDGLPAPALACFQPRRPHDVDVLLEHLCGPRIDAALLVDCTASDEVADWYPRLLCAGIGVVGANKRANARDLASWRQLQDCAHRHAVPYRYETTVGAAIPLLGPLRDLRLRGEGVLSLEGLLSGSLSHVLHRVHAGCAFSEAVAEARALGFTEPDPLDDLQAVDLSRKLLVLARECGFALEPGDLQVEPLVDPGIVRRDGLESALRAEDARWRERVAQAEQAGERWVVLAGADARGGSIAARRAPLASPFATLPAGQNLVCIRTTLQDAAPLLLGGPGAGPEVTAAGLLSDVLAAAGELAWRRR
jgi:aspartokinase/homoserine dehydrogenase 1